MEFSYIIGVFMEERVSFYFTEKGEYAPREGLPFIQRKNVAAIVKYDKEYLLLNWNETNYNISLITGGIEEDESREEAVRREVVEETGYYDIKNITEVDCINVSKFYVEHKNQNREAIYYPYLVELNSLKKMEIDDFELKEHSCVWMNKSELNQACLFENHRKMLKKSFEIDSKEGK